MATESRAARVGVETMGAVNQSARASQELTADNLPTWV